MRSSRCAARHESGFSAGCGAAGRHRRPVTSPVTQLGGQVECPSLPPRCTYHDEPSCLIASPVETRPRVPVKAECCRHSLVAGVCRDHCYWRRIRACTSVISSGLAPMSARIVCLSKAVIFSGMASFPRQMAAITVRNFSGSREDQLPPGDCDTAQLVVVRLLPPATRFGRIRALGAAGRRRSGSRAAEWSISGRSAGQPMSARRLDST